MVTYIANYPVVHPCEMVNMNIGREGDLYQLQAHRTLVKIG